MSRMPNVTAGLRTGRWRGGRSVGPLWPTWYLAVWALAALAGCRKTVPPVPDVIRSLGDRGSVKFSVEARPNQAWLGDPIHVTIAVHTPDDYLVQFPAESDFGKLEVHTTDTPDPSPAPQGGLNWRRSFVIETFTSGTLEIPPLTVKYARKPADLSAKPDLDNEWVSDTLKVEVRSALTTQDSPMQPRDITATLVPARPRRLWPWLVAGGAVHRRSRRRSGPFACSRDCLRMRLSPAKRASSTINLARPCVPTSRRSSPWRRRR